MSVFLFRLRFKPDFVARNKQKGNKKLIFNFVRLIYAARGEVAEWSKAAVLKTVEG